MSETIFPSLRQTIDDAEYPIIVLIVNGTCDQQKSSFEQEFEQTLQNRPENLVYYASCVPERMMGFPRLATPMAYYFVPKNQTPVFWRGQDAIVRIPEDIPVLCKMAQGMSEHEARFSPEDQERIASTDKMLATEDMSKFPPLFQQMRNFGKEMWVTGKRAALGLPILVSTEVAFARYQICQGCEQFEAETTRCKSCGCFMRAKTNLASGSCPLSKWPTP